MVKNENTAGYLGMPQVLGMTGGGTIQQKKHNIEEFEIIDTLGHGNFGQVRLVKHIDSNLYFALKTIKKEEITKPKQIEHIKRERDILLKLSK